MVSIFKLHKFAHPLYQFILAICTTTILGLIILKPVFFFQNFDQPPTLMPISKEIKESSSPILTGLHVKNFLDFDIAKNSFFIEGMLWFIFDPKKISLEEISKFSFPKGEFGENEFLKDEYNTSQVIDLSEHEKFIKYNIRLKFSTNLNYKMFPLDSHKFYITLVNKHLPIEKGYFVTPEKYFVVDKHIYTPGWKRINQNVQAGDVKMVLSEDDSVSPMIFPRAVFSIDFIMDNLRYVLFLLFPLLALFFVSLFSLALNPNNESQMQIIIPQTASCLIGVLAYRLVIEAASPKVPYFMLIDNVFNIFMIFTAFIFALSILRLQEKWRGLFVILLNVLLIIFWAYLILF